MNQIKVDKIGINRVLGFGRIVDTKVTSGLGALGTLQILLFSLDGKEKVLLGEKGVDVSSWAVNEITGTITLFGHSMMGGESMIDVYDLKTLKKMHR